MATLLLLLIYTAFISLGLPDAILGAGWPVMQPELNIPYGYAGIIQMLISGGTIISSVFSGFLIKRFSTGKITTVSVALTAGALLGFGFAPSFLWILAAAIPLGLGAGAVDAGLNAYVANHYESRHMSWLHSFWGVGALGGPMVLSLLLSHGFSWRLGYKSVGCFQIFLVIILFLAIPLWDKVKARNSVSSDKKEDVKLSFMGVMKIRGVPMVLIAFLFYCGIEATMGLWGGSFLFKAKGLSPEKAAVWVSLFYGSITLGRFLTGFLTFRWSNDRMILCGMLIILGGVLLMLLPLPLHLSLTGFLAVGFGCAPVFPSMLHETPVQFGRETSHAVMGLQMAAAYIGSTFLPPVFGFIAGITSHRVLPFFLLGYILMFLFCFGRLKRHNIQSGKRD